MSLDLKEQYNKIYTFCYFKVKNKDFAEDITQETFLKYFETTDYLEKGKKLAYLYTIARNLCIDHFRKSKMSVPIETVAHIMEENSKDLDTIMTVQNAVSKLPEEDQEIVLLRYKNGLGVSEISVFLGISRFALYRKMKTIEKLLSEALKREDFYE